MKKNTKVLIGGGMIFLSILILLITATPASSGSEVPIEQLKQQPEEFEERYITTEGFLVEGSVDWNPDEIELRFEIKDEEGLVLPVFYHGVQPDNFSDDVIVIVHGYTQEDGLFEAEKVQTRCPSVYEGEDPDKYDPELHREMDIDLNTEVD
ncbi:cytochrome c maturation protein CcmE [Salipaludibacillus sp. CUR1]|uniref:Cytochrome c-type biogenesis protein CcmE n=1 Tax=Salipaludibacillus aurantiacus TaxID=1601833 RepID=A0A1H9X7X5_9BACI|nr:MULTISPECIES: cytochrome c maturation protein CcmE [Salipaludibacillus]MCE7792818.1 cytochrome c maturation protein CcmE [Salipaludibacillus sp. CUR1]SES42171.1 cytochrome c-type biogenesis protein CcmE [Salipaludibacillus aurantiacus]